MLLLPTSWSAHVVTAAPPRWRNRFLMVPVIRRQSARSCRPANTMSSPAQPKLSYDADKFTVELSVAEYSPEVCRNMWLQLSLTIHRKIYTVILTDISYDTFTDVRISTSRPRARC